MKFKSDFEKGVITQVFALLCHALLCVVVCVLPCGMCCASHFFLAIRILRSGGGHDINSMVWPAPLHPLPS